MTGRMARAAVVGLTLAGAAGGCGAAASAADRWTTYVNPRFGTTVDYPARLFTRLAPPPENGDGQEFLTADGRASLSIYGAFNIESDTPKSFLDRVLRDKAAKASYVQTTARFFVLSWLDDGKITYQRCNFPLHPPNGVEDCVSMTYPAAEKRGFDPIVARISRSLRAGPGDQRR